MYFEYGVVRGEKFGEIIDIRTIPRKTLTDAGVPLKVAMKKAGFSDEEIAEAVALKEKEQARADANLATQNRIPNPA